MLLRIRPDDPLPLFEQIAGQLRRAMAEEQLVPGERLPPARELASSLEVNMHTVLRAYDLLRQEGLLEVRRGRGVTVAGHAADRTRLLELGRAFLQEGKKQGLSLVELSRVMEAL